MMECCGILTKKRQYSVKSDYQIGFQLKYHDILSCLGDVSKCWNDLWTLNLPEKIKIFL